MKVRIYLRVSEYNPKRSASDAFLKHLNIRISIPFAVLQEPYLWRQCDDRTYKPEWGYYDGGMNPIAIVNLEEKRPVITISASAENGQWMIFMVLRKTKNIMDYREFTLGTFSTKSGQHVKMSDDIHTPSFPIEQLGWSTFPGPKELLLYGVPEVSGIGTMDMKCPQIIQPDIK